MVNISIQLPDCFFEEETKLNYHITKKQKEVWAVELDLLKKFDEVCKSLNVRYFLDSGTLLGAVRDGHFIPWDDDIDVIMFRKDYDVLLQKGPSCFKEPYFLQNPYTDYGYFRGHTQIRNSNTCAILPQELGKETFNQGIFLDVFVMDGLNDEILAQQNEQRERYLRIKSFIKNPVSPHPIKRLIKPFMIRMYKKRYGDLQGLYSRIEDLYRGQTDTELVDKLLFRKKASKLMRLHRSWFDESVSMQFEGFEFPVPKEYDKILRVYYGDDYMTPRQHVGVIHDEFGEVIFDTARSYKDVIREKGFQI